MRGFPSTYSVKVRSLLTLEPTDVLWNQLMSLTVEGWKAGKIFRRIRRLKHESGYTKARIRIVYRKGIPIAWSMWCKHTDDEYPWLCLYTHPNYRQLGIQKRIMIPYWKNHIDCMTRVQSKHVSQKETFKYFGKNLRVAPKTN